MSVEEGLVALRTPGAALRWAAAGTPVPGEARSGDAYLVVPASGGVVVALLDALGHGPEAAGVAARALDALRASAGSPADRLRDCHLALAATRGAVAAIAELDASGAMAWAGVGNVEAFVVDVGGRRAAVRSALVCRPGILGASLPPVRQARVQLGRHDLLLMGTDGVDPAFVDDVRPGDDPGAAVRRIAGRRLRRDDDATVVAARLDRPPPHN